MVTEIYSEAVVPFRTRRFFHQCMIYFDNILELHAHKYKSNGNLREGNYKENFLFSVNDFVSFGTYNQSMLFMSNIFLKDNIYGFHVPQFQPAYIHNTNIN